MFMSGFQSKPKIGSDWKADLEETKRAAERIKQRGKPMERPRDLPDPTSMDQRLSRAADAKAKGYSREVIAAIMEGRG
jgi:hypothetical protein